MIELDLRMIAGEDEQAIKWLNGREHGIGLLREFAPFAATRRDADHTEL